MEVQHPLLDRVRQCSADPDNAAAFFAKILSPAPHVRQEAIHGKWCADKVSRMFAATDSSYESYPAAEAAKLAAAKAKATSKPIRCAALRSCFNCCMPSIKDDEVVIAPAQLEEPVAAMLSENGLDCAIDAQAVGPNGSQSAAGALQMENSMQQNAARCFARRCWSGIKGTLTGKAKHSKQHMGKDATPLSSRGPSSSGGLQKIPAVVEGSSLEQPATKLSKAHSGKGIAFPSSVSVSVAAGACLDSPLQQQLAQQEQIRLKPTAADTAPECDGATEVAQVLEDGGLIGASRQQPCSSHLSEHRCAVCKMNSVKRAVKVCMHELLTDQLRYSQRVCTNALNHLL